MTIKGYLAPDSDNTTYLYFMQDPSYLERDEDGEWQVLDKYYEDYSPKLPIVNLKDNWDLDVSFGILREIIENELEHVQFPTKDEDPVEIELNLSINWF